MDDIYARAIAAIEADLEASQARVARISETLDHLRALAGVAPSKKSKRAVKSDRQTDRQTDRARTAPAGRAEPP